MEVALVDSIEILVTVQFNKPSPHLDDIWALKIKEKNKHFIYLFIC